MARPTKNGEREDQQGSKPKAFPETTPPSYPSTDHSFTVQGVFEIKASVAALDERVKHLKESMDEARNDLKSVQRTLWVASGVVLAVSTIGGFFLNKIWDSVALLVSRLPAQ